MAVAYGRYCPAHPLVCPQNNPTVLACIGRVVRLSLYGSSQALELSSGGKYALVMPVMDMQEWQFWRPNSGVSDTK
jgi:hypothetical protein